MKVIVNGASGYIGYHLVNSLLKNNHEVYAICRSNTGHLKDMELFDNLHIIITEQSGVVEKLHKVVPDVWYQLAWEGACGEGRSNPELQIKNEMLSVNAMKIAKQIGCCKIIYAGTVYENILDAILEKEVFYKNSFYIISKKHAHEMTYQLSKKLCIDYVWCTFCHPVGKYMSEKQLLPYAVKCFLNNQPTEFGSCSQYFDVISVEDLSDAFVVLGENKCRKTEYYIGSGNPRILREYIEEAADICGYKLEVGFGKRHDDGLVFKREWFDTINLKTDFSFLSFTEFKNIILEYIKM